MHNDNLRSVSEYVVEGVNGTAFAFGSKEGNTYQCSV